MTILTIDYSDLLNDFRTNDPLNWNTDMSDYWPFGPVHDFRTNEPSGQWPFRISSCPRSDHVIIKSLGAQQRFDGITPAAHPPCIAQAKYEYSVFFVFTWGHFWSWAVPISITSQASIGSGPIYLSGQVQTMNSGRFNGSRDFRKSVNLMRIDQISSISAWTWET